MKYNKVNKYSMNKFDKSYENIKYIYPKTNINNNKLPINKKNNNNYTTFQNLNKKKAKKDNEINYIDNNKLNLLHIQNYQTNNKSSKNKYLKFKNSQMKRDCLTPDKNINNLKFGLTAHKKENKNNIILLKYNMQRNQSFIEYHFKNSSKRFLTRSKSKNNIMNLSNEKQKALTPDKINKARNNKISKSQISNKNEENKKIKNTNNYGQNQIFMNFSKSFKNQNNFNISNLDFSNYSILNNSSINKKRLLVSDKRKTPDKYNNKKFNTKLVKDSKLPMLTKISNDSLSKSFCSHKNSYKSENQKNDYLFSNLKLNKAKKEFNKIYMNNYYSKGVSRSKSTDSNYKKKIFNFNIFKNDNSYIKQNSKNKKINNNLINNISYENMQSNYNKNNNNIINYPNKFYNAFNNTDTVGNYNLNQINQKNRKVKNEKNNVKNNLIIKNTFLEMAQKKINNKNALNIKNYKYKGINNFFTKSSTNTNDEINSTNSIISKHNQILDSIEEIHFNFVNVVQSSRNLMKYQENIEGEKIINNNPNSTVIILEEKDID